jgi:hypothetical protein
MTFFRYTQKTEGQYICELDLSELYQPEDLDRFWLRYADFCKADPLLAQMIEIKGDTLIYPHKSWVPKLSDNRPKVLFLFGNPAPHSVIADIYFAYEGKGTEHRFWKVMREMGIIDMQNAKSEEMKSNFFKLRYASPFVIGMEVFFTFPSPASEKKWSGVMGLQKLFGKKVFDRIAQAEKIRVEEVIQNFIGTKGMIIAFQKDAYNGVAKAGNRYDLVKAVWGELRISYSDSVTLIGVPPTRWLHTAKMKTVLKELITR